MSITTQRLLLQPAVLEREEQVQNIVEPRPRAALNDPHAVDHSIVGIIPLYNGGAYIAESLTSILAQTRPADEILVVNDGSTDDGPEIVRRIIRDHPQVRLLNIAEPGRNRGQSAARNYGVEHSSSDLIAFLDQDDIWYPDHLKVLYEAYCEPTACDIGWVYSNLDETDENLNLIARGYLNQLPAKHPKTDLFECLRRDMFILPSSSLISRLAFKRVGGFDERLCGYEDDDLFLRMFRLGYENRFVAQPLSKWRIHRGSASYSPRMAKSRRVYIRKLIDAFPDDPGRNRFYRRDLIAPRFLQHCWDEYHTALRSGGDDEHADECLRVIVELTSYLPNNFRKTKMLLVLRMLQNRPFARWVHNSGLRKWVRLVRGRLFR